MNKPLRDALMLWFDAVALAKPHALSKVKGLHATVMRAWDRAGADAEPTYQATASLWEIRTGRCAADGVVDCVCRTQRAPLP